MGKKDTDVGKTKISAALHADVCALFEKREQGESVFPAVPQVSLEEQTAEFRKCLKVMFQEIGEMKSAFERVCDLFGMPNGPIERAKYRRIATKHVIEVAAETGLENVAAALLVRSKRGRPKAHPDDVVDLMQSWRMFRLWKPGSSQRDFLAWRQENELHLPPLTEEQIKSGLDALRRARAAAAKLRLDVD